MKVLNREEVPRLEGVRTVNMDGGYLGHHEPCDDPDQFKVRYAGGAGKPDVVKTFARE
jgi:hypothetical protein